VNFLIDLGFTFYTNYEGRKARELAENPNAALVFYWPQLHRQIRIEGSVAKVDKEMSEEYFRSRSKVYILKVSDRLCLFLVLIFCLSYLTSNLTSNKLRLHLNKRENNVTIILTF
jgi:hypothetical protein